MLIEHNIITRLQQAFSQCAPGITGIGDDAAVIPLNERKSYVITKDLLVEDKHFSLRYYDPESLAHKTLHVNLSDMAAMGAIPCYGVLGLSIPITLSEEFLDQFLNYFSLLCQDNGVHLIGGDTTASGDKFVISLTVIGRVETNQLKFRTGAQPGDLVAVVENLGYAHMGLIAIEKDTPGLELFKTAALRPLSRVKEGLWFGAQKNITAMMDISDGLYIDLMRLCEASKVGAQIDVESLIPSTDFLDACSKISLDPLECMLIGGEDYGLLVTIKADVYEEIARAFAAAFGYQLTHIGKITDTSGVKLIRKEKEVPFTYHPFSHFGEL